MVPKTIYYLPISLVFDYVNYYISLNLISSYKLIT